MQYTDYYELNLPETTDAVRVEDLNENTRAIEGILEGILEEIDISTITGAEIWGGNNLPTNITIDGAFSKLAQSIPSTMGTPGTVLTAGANGASWGSNLFYPELVAEITVNVSSAMDWIADIPTGWSTANMTGILIRGDLTWVGKHNGDYDSSPRAHSENMTIGYLPITSSVYFPASDSYVTGDEEAFTFLAQFSNVSIAEGTTSVWADDGTDAAYFYTNDNGVVTSAYGDIGFPYNSSADEAPFAESLTGTIQFYVLREVN